MRIDHIITSLGAGGAESLVANLAVSQKRSGHQVSVWLMDDAPTGSQEFQATRIARLGQLGIPVSVLGSGSRDSLRAGLRLRKHLPRSSATLHVIHCHSAATIAAAALGAHRTPIVVTLHSTEVNFPAPLWRVVSRRISAVAAVSEGASDSFSRFFGRPVQVIPNGTELLETPIRSFQPHWPEFRMLAVGSLRAAKNYRRLLSAFRQILPEALDRGLDLRLDIAGEGVERRVIEQEIARLGLVDRVRLLGVQGDIAQLMLESDLFVMSSDHEGQPIALLEALAAGLPTVVTPFPSVFDVLRNGEVGLIADAFTSSSLAETLTQALADPQELNRLSEAGRLRASDFSIEECARRYQRLYDTACA